jgi:hypothetical protein
MAFALRVLILTEIWFGSQGILFQSLFLKKGDKVILRIYLLDSFSQKLRPTQKNFIFVRC